MLEPLLYRHSRDIWQGLASRAGKNIVAIVPDPMRADYLRLLLEEEGIEQVEVKTISLFVKDYLTSQMGNDSQLRLARKADLLMGLGKAWRNYGQALGNQRYLQYSFFEKIYRIFSELRSYTLDQELWNSVLSLLPEDLAEGVFLLGQVYENYGLWDEQSTYYYMKQALLKEEGVEEQHFFFWGFDHFSAQQIDWLKSLAIRHQVTIPIAQALIPELDPADYISWLWGEDFWKKFSFTKMTENIPVECIQFSEGSLAETLKAELPLDAKTDLYLGTRKLQLEHLQDLPFENLRFKIPLDWGEGQLAYFSNWIAAKVGEGIWVCDLTEALTQEIQRANESENDILVKICCAYLLTLKRNYEDQEMIFPFDQQLLEQINALNLPRIFKTSLRLFENHLSIYDLKQVSLYEESSWNVLCLGGQFEKPVSASDLFNEKALSFLREIGPVRRKEFEILNLRQRIEELCSHSKVLLVVEREFLQHDVDWPQILEGLDLRVRPDSPRNKIPLSTQLPFMRVNGVFEETRGVSASRLQSYIDCPRRFYFTYIDKVSNEASLANEVDVRILGEIEHQLIQSYFESAGTCSLEEEAKRLLFQQLNENDIHLGEKNLEKSLLELVSYAQNGISLLESVIEQKKLIKIEFEKELKKGQGRIDCLLTTHAGTYLFDFKRGKSSIGTLTEIWSYDKIQLWFYLARLDIALTDLAGFGYICLKDISASTLISLVGKEQLNENVKFSPGELDKVESGLDEYRVFEAEQIEKLKNEKLFLPHAKNNKSCVFCDFRSVCPERLI